MTVLNFDFRQVSNDEIMDRLGKRMTQSYVNTIHVLVWIRM